MTKHHSQLLQKTNKTSSVIECFKENPDFDDISEIKEDLSEQRARGSFQVVADTTCGDLLCVDLRRIHAMCRR